jgi:hypothetical protein
MITFGMLSTQLSIALPSVAVEYAGMLWSELREFLGHYIIVLLALAMTGAATWSWFDNEWQGWPRLNGLRRRSRHGVIIVLVLAILAFSKFKTNRVVRERTAQESRVRAERAYTYTNSQLEATPKPDPSEQLVILSQGIGQITTRTFDLIQNTHPEFKLRAISIHLKLNNGIEDVIQEGELKKDRTIFPADTSFVGATILGKKRKYCPDTAKRETDSQCQPFAEPGSGPPADLPYTSLICYPFSVSHDDVFGAVCLDSVIPHAFDDAVSMKSRQDTAYENIRDQMAQLATLLHAFKDVRSNLQSAPRRPREQAH